MMLISESGLYTLVMRSNKPEAKVFQKWVSAEFRRDAKILDLNGVGVVTETRFLVSVTTCRNIRQVQLEGNHEVSQKFWGRRQNTGFESRFSYKGFLYNCR